jgi:hypothetical protein
LEDLGGQEILKEYNGSMLTATKRLGKDSILDSGSVSLTEHEPYETPIVTSDKTEFRVTICVENTKGGATSINSADTGSQRITITLRNLPDGPGFMREPMEIAHNDALKIKILFTLISEGIQDGKRQITYTILERKDSQDPQ